MNQKISAPQKADITDLAKRVLRVQQLSELHLTRQMKGDDSDLTVLQELLDSGLIKVTDTYDLQCLGIVLGRRIVHALLQHSRESVERLKSKVDWPA